MTPPHQHEARSLYYEDLPIGTVCVSSRRTLTETDLSMFSMLSGDWNAVHADAVTMADRGSDRILHGVLGIAVLTGLMDKAGWFDTSALAMTGIDDWRFLKPLMIGDTIHVRMEITEQRLTRKPGRGYVGRRFSIINQRDETVQEGEIGVLVLMRSDSSRA